MAKVQLPLGDINVVAVTDVHSWVAGHSRHEPFLDADYGDVLSFYQELEEAANKVGKDVFFVMNGDMVDGTGLSTVPPEQLLPIIETMPFSAVNMGNHELYHNETVEYLRSSGFIEHWNGNYLTTNTFWEETKDYIGHPYTYLYGKHSQTKILTFGFLYNFMNNCKVTTVMKVEETVQKEWFQQVLLQRDYDAILVLAHMDYIDPLVSIIHTSIRALVGPEMPIQFINGHSHRRGFHAYDRATSAMEAGRYLDTVGFVSFPTYDSVRKSDAPDALFRHVFLDANKKALAEAVGNFDKTNDGSSLTDFIHQTQDDMGIERVLGCSARSYSIDQPLNASDSLYGLYMRQVFPFTFAHNHSKVVVQSTGALRYSLLQGEVTLDDLIAVSPFDDLMYLAAHNISGSDLLAAFGGDLMQTETNPRDQPWPYIFSGPGINPHRIYDVYAADFDLSEVRRRVQDSTGRNLEPSSLLKGNDGTVVTTSNIWQSFVVENWPCSIVSPMRRLTHEYDNSAFFSICVCTGLNALFGGSYPCTQEDDERTFVLVRRARTE